MFLAKANKKPISNYDHVVKFLTRHYIRRTKKKILHKISWRKTEGERGNHTSCDVVDAVLAVFSPDRYLQNSCVNSNDVHRIGALQDVGAKPFA